MLHSAVMHIYMCSGKPIMNENPRKGSRACCCCATSQNTPPNMHFHRVPLQKDRYVCYMHIYVQYVLYIHVYHLTWKNIHIIS